MKVRFAGQNCAGSLPLSPGERGLLLGDGVFETILALNGRPVWLSGHLDRLLSSASVLGLKAARPELEREARAVIGPGPGVIRLTVMRGEGPRSLGAGGSAEATVMASFSRLSAGTIRFPVRLAVSAVRRNEGSPASRMKTLSYMDNILAAREAVLRGADDALMLNNAGRVACASVGNIFAVKGSRLLTPPGTEGVLAGIARQHVLNCALRLGLCPAEEPLGVEDLTAADSVFITNSLRLVSPVTELDGVVLKRSPADAAARLFAFLCGSVLEDTGCDPRSLAASGI